WYEVAIQEYHSNPTIAWHNSFLKSLTIRGGAFDPAQPSVMTADPALTRPVSSGAPPVSLPAPTPVNFSRSGKDTINTAESPRAPVGPTGTRPRIGGTGGTIAAGVGQRISQARSRMRGAEGKQEWDSFAHMQQYLTGYLAADKIQDLNDLLTRF